MEMNGGGAVSPYSRLPTYPKLPEVPSGFPLDYVGAATSGPLLRPPVAPLIIASSFRSEASLLLKKDPPSAHHMMDLGSLGLQAGTCAEQHVKRNKRIV